MPFIGIHDPQTRTLQENKSHQVWALRANSGDRADAVRFRGNVKISHDVIDRIRQIPVEDVLHKLGARRRGRSWYCPFHDDQTPSASVKHNRFRCFVCSPECSWSSIDLVMKSLDLDFVEAVRWLADHFGIVIPYRQSKAGERREAVRRRAIARSRAAGLADWRSWQISNLRWCRDRLWSNERRACRWGFQHIGDPAFDNDPRWDAVWSAIMQGETGERLNAALNRLKSLTPAECLRLGVRLD